MSINIYVSEEIRKQRGFTDVPYNKKDGSGGMHFEKMTLFGNEGRLYAMLGESGAIPPTLAQFVTDVSLYVNMSAELSRRETGIYKLDDAEAEVEIQQLSKGKEGYLMKVKATKLESARELVLKIKTGSIRPTESFEGSQQGKSKAELETELVKLQRRNAQIGAELELARERVAVAYQIAAKLDGRWWNRWPWCCKSTVATQITRGLNGATTAK